MYIKSIYIFVKKIFVNYTLNYWLKCTLPRRRPEPLADRDIFS